MSIHDLENDHDELMRTLTKQNAELLRAMEADRDRVRVTTEERAFLKRFWHEIDHEVVPSIPYAALFHMTKMETRHHRHDTYGQLQNSFNLLLANLHLKHLIKENFLIKPSDVVTLTDKAISFIQENHPKQHALYLAVKDIMQYKVTIVFAIIGFVASIIQIVQLFI